MIRPSCHHLMIASVVAAALALPSAGRGQTASTWVYSGDNNRTAAVSFARFLEDHELDARLDDEEALVRVRYKAIRYTLELKCSQRTGMDRVIIHAFFDLDERWKDTKELLVFTNKLNQKYNIGCFYVDKDGDLAFTSSIAYINRLSWELIEAQLDHLEFSFTAVMFSGSEEFLKYAEKR